MKENKSKPARGSLLISEPFMMDPNFQRTIVLLTEHNKEGSIGFVLNRTSGLYLNDAIPDFPKFNAPLYYGGPVQPDTLHFIHKAGHLLDSSTKLAEGIFWGGNFEELKILVEQKQVKPGEFRFFLGYSGWSPGQLKEEIDNDVWLVADSKHSYIFSSSPEVLWGKVLEDIGSKFAVIAHFPESPSLN